MKVKNNKIQRFLLISFLLFIVYLIIFSLYFFVFSQKLSQKEYTELSKIYVEMRKVDNSIKDDYYVNNLLKVLNKKYIINEFKKDSLLYCISVGENAFGLIEIYDYDNICKYIRRCTLNFEDFVGMQNRAEILKLYYNYFYNLESNLENPSSLEELGDTITYLIYDDNEQISRENTNRFLLVLTAIISYIVLVVLINILLNWKTKKNLKIGSDCNEKSE